MRRLPVPNIWRAVATLVASGVVILSASCGPTDPDKGATPNKQQQRVAVVPPSVAPQEEITGPRVYLTFDDGPDPRWTPQILKVLQKYHAHATFFVVCSKAKQYPQLLRDEQTGGNIVGDHTWDHKDLRKLQPKWVTWELKTCQDFIYATTSVKPTLWRPPDGFHDPAIDKAAGDLGMALTLWTYDSKDWSRPGADSLVRGVVSDSRLNGKTLLWHDGGGVDRSQTVAALDRILAILQARGYHFPARDRGLQ